MIAFASLFLGLVLGLQPVEVTVGEGVAAVEIVLNDRSLGRMRGEPWTIDCDFGPELIPHKLEAVAYDADDREIGRVVQWINLPQTPAVATAVVEPAREDRPAVARLAWESRGTITPRSVVASFDGQPLPVDDPRRIALPAHDPQDLHFFHAELDFGAGVRSFVDLVFGGTFGDEVRTEMTAVPVLVDKRGRRPPPPAALQGWFLRNGEPLEVVAVEKGPAEILVVQNRPFPPVAEKSGSARSNRLNPIASTAETARGRAPLADDVRVRFLIPTPQDHVGVTTRFNLFPTSGQYTSADGGLYWLLTRVRQSGMTASEQHLADAVAVAGLAAHERRCRRAVLLILGSEVDDGSQLTPAQARRYLGHLHVPLLFWSPDKHPSPTLAAWGEPIRVPSVGQFNAAARALYKLLERQWIVWLNGTYLPQEIRLAPAAEGISIVH